MSNSDKRKLQKDYVYMNIAEQIGSLSHCKRKQVGAILVKDENIISTGFNGTPTGMDNCCEDSESNETLWYTLHAETNCISKIAKSTLSSEGSTLYITLSPCKNCAKLILQAGITKILFKVKHSCNEGIDFLISQGIECIHLSDPIFIKPKLDNKKQLLEIYSIFCAGTKPKQRLLDMDEFWLKENLNFISNNTSEQFYEYVLSFLKNNYFNTENHNAHLTLDKIYSYITNGYPKTDTLFLELISKIKNEWLRIHLDKIKIKYGEDVYDLVQTHLVKSGFLSNNIYFINEKDEIETHKLDVVFKYHNNTHDSLALMNLETIDKVWLINNLNRIEMKYNKLFYNYINNFLKSKTKEHD